MTWSYFKRRLKQVLFEGDNELHISNIRYLPRWFVIFLDLFFVCLSVSGSYLLISRLPFYFYNSLDLISQAGILLGVQFIFFLVFKTYAGLIRHSTFVDILKIALAVFSTAITLAIGSYFYYYITGYKIYNIPSLVIYSVLSFFLLWVFRQVVKQVYSHYSTALLSGRFKRVLILGVTDDTIAIAEALGLSFKSEFVVAGFLSEKPGKTRMTVGGKVIYSIDKDLERIKEDKNIDGVLLVGSLSNSNGASSLIDQLLNTGFKIYHAPLIQEWDRESALGLNIKSIQIEDLLERSPIRMNDQQIGSYIFSKNLLVTGGAGSIGSELVRQILKYQPKKLVIIDNAESPLHDLKIELLDSFPDEHIDYILADVKNTTRLEDLFSEYVFDVVFHAAAYKHVPLVEQHPQEGFFTNLMGTKNLADLSAKHHVDRFVMISTDKAVNPTSVMGATKRAAELYVQYLHKSGSCNTQFITTRFGNVLGSNGSVIPRFKSQIRNGGPVTVTHPDIIRYFMTIEEACQLVLQAGIMGSGGEIFVFDMGEPVKIVELAQKMIRLSGFEPGREVEIVFTGLRPGEKLYEELLNDKNHVIPTYHEKILKAVNQNAGEDNILDIIALLESPEHKWNNHEMVAALKRVIPEYKSQNSQYCTLDKAS